MILLMLEDDVDRLERFEITLRTVAPACQLYSWRNARVMLREINTVLTNAALISLDHDLEPASDDAEEPGDGWEVAQVLSELAPCCPIIIHSSNGPRAQWMAGAFELGGWEHHLIAPLGDDWIERDWGVLVRKMLKKRNR